MSSRRVHPQPFEVPEGVNLPAFSTLHLENVSHTPGQAAAIRFFDENSEEDLFAAQEILRGKQVRRWMDEVSTLSRIDYQDWAGAHTSSSFLFAVLDARESDPEKIKYVRGFIFIYSEREEKFRVKRMEKLGFFAPSLKKRYLLEVSFAARAVPDNMQQAPGLMSSALRQSCLQVKALVQSAEEDSEVEIFGFVDPENYAAQRTLEASGFVKKGLMKYDWDSPEENYLYMLSWPLLQEKLRDKLLQILQAQQPTSGGV